MPLTARATWPDTPAGEHGRRDVLTALDLNMLPALRALLQERSVTRAAARLGVRQPAASAALRRLRTHFQDPLLVRAGLTYELSPLAVALLTQVEQALAAAEAVLLERSAFNAASSRRRFTVLSSDTDFLLVGDRLLRRLAGTPRITLDVVPLNAAALHEWEQTIRSVDLLFLPRGAVADYPSATLWYDQWVLVTGSRSGLGGDEVTAARLAEMTWIEPYRGALQTASCMDAWGVEPQAQVAVPSAALLLVLLRDSARHVTVLPRRVAGRLAALGGLRILDGPAPAPLQMAQWWHPARADDPGHAWLRALVQQAAAERAG